MISALRALYGKKEDAWKSNEADSKVRGPLEKQDSSNLRFGGEYKTQPMQEGHTENRTTSHGWAAEFVPQKRFVSRWKLQVEKYIMRRTTYNGCDNTNTESVARGWEEPQSLSVRPEAKIRLPPCS